MNASTTHVDSNGGDNRRQAGGFVKSTYIITTLTKISGLVIAANEALLRTELRPVALAVAAFMMAGAQGLDSFLGSIFRPPLPGPDKS